MRQTPFGCRAGFGHVDQAPLADSRAQHLHLDSLNCARLRAAARFAPITHCLQLTESVLRCLHFARVLRVFRGFVRSSRVPLGCLIHLRTVGVGALYGPKSDLLLPNWAM